MQQDIQQKKQPEATESSTILQASLFGPASVIAEPPNPLETAFPPLVRTHPLTDQSSLAASTIPYQQELTLRGKSNYTVTCFLSDLKMFSEFVGYDTPVGRITREHLADWLMKLKFGTKGQVPAPKTMARRVTFLKNFFSWLARDGIIKEDPAASLTLERPLPPLPDLLFSHELQRLLEAASQDSRCHCLVYLVLHAGLKKEEVMGLKVHHVDLSDPGTPIIRVLFEASTRKQHRERFLALPAEFSSIFAEYQNKYHITDAVFDCTDRNLNYILAKAVKTAGITRRVTLQLLRDTFAVEQLKAKVPFEDVREKLGLSEEAWLESKEKYRRLAFPK